MGELRELVLELLGWPEPVVDPYPVYRELRHRAPTHRDASGVWFFTRYEDVAAALRHPSLGRAPVDEPWPILGGVPRQVRRMMLFLNPPEHTRRRRLVSRGFGPGQVERLRPRIEQLTDELLDGLAEAGGGDVMESLAFPLAAATVGELLGVPRADQGRFRRIAHDLGTALDPIQVTAAPERFRDASRSARDHFHELLELRRRQPVDDLLTVLATAGPPDDGGLSDDEAVLDAVLLFAAGFETTTNLIGSGLLALLEHDDQLEALRGDPELVPNAVEEMLRFDSPVHLTPRYALDDVDIAGTRIPAGETVVALLAAGNRDPERFSAPDRFDIGRDEGPPLSFGGGLHACLGAMLARVEVAICIQRLLARFSDIELRAEPVRRTNVALRGVHRLELELGAAS